MPRPACLALTKKPGLRVLFGARDENREHTEVVGEFLAIPVTGPQLVATVKRMLAEDASLARPTSDGVAVCRCCWSAPAPDAATVLRSRAPGRP